MNTLERLEKLLGGIPFWVPCHRGSKIPSVTYTERPYSETTGPVWRSLLTAERASEGGPPNLAIYLGAASHGLCAIDFDKDEDLAEFLGCNAKLRASLRSKGARGAQIWVRIKGEIPASSMCPHYEWRGHHRLSTIWGRHPSGVDYQLLVEAPVAVMEFGEITWPKGWHVPGEQSEERRFAAEFGEPWLSGKDGAPSRLNQRHFAGRLARTGDIVFDPDAGRFFGYAKERGLWRYRTDDEVVGMIGEAAAKDMIATGKAHGAEAQAAMRRGQSMISHPFCKGAAGLLRGMVAERGRFEKPRGIVHCLNGMLDLNEKSFSLKPFAREYWSRNQVAVKYDPAAKCPRYLAELLGPQMSAEDQRLWQLCCGQYLLGRNLYQNFLILTGTASGGKGTLCKLVMHIVGTDNVHELRTNQLTSRFETSFFNGKSLLYGPDVEPGFLSTDGAHVIKALTGGDFMSGEVKGSSTAHKLEGDYNILISCNSRLMARLRGDSAAWARRLLLICFEAPPVARPIPRFDQVLFENEGSGILNWMLEGAKIVMDCARECKPFPLTEAQRERVNSLLAESDSVREFIKRRVRRSNLLADNVTVEALYAGYLETCDKNGWLPVSPRLFGIKSEEILVTEIRASKDLHLGENRCKRGWRGLVLTEEIDLDDPENY